jgi:chitodextrinase
MVQRLLTGVTSCCCPIAKTLVGHAPFFVSGSCSCSCGTPVVAPATDTLYFVSKSVLPSGHCPADQGAAYPGVIFLRQSIRDTFFLRGSLSRGGLPGIFAANQHQPKGTHVKRALGNRVLQHFFFLAFSTLCLVLIVSGCNTTSTPPPDTTPPTAPGNLAVTAASTTQINLSWTASTDNVGVTGYRVERCPGAGCSNFAQIAATTNTAFSDTGLTASTSYSYRVRATDAAGNLSAYSNTATSTPAPPDTTPPTAPTNLTATAASTSQINLAWTASNDNVGVTGYKVERCQGAACSNFAQISTPTGTTFSDMGLTASTSYSYRVRATDAANNLSAYSNTASASTPAPPDTTPPTAPTNLIASAVSDTRINLSWTASTDNVGVTGYMVERCQGAACSNFAQISAPTGTTFNDTGLNASTPYSYRVRATDAAGNLSSYSSTGTALTAAGPISVAITPVRGGATFSQSLNFTANLQNDVTAAGATWTASGGTISSQGKIAATYVAPNAVGNVTITATSVADATKSVSATIAVTDLTGVLTWHNDSGRTGQNLKEYALTPSLVAASTFGKLFSCQVDGAVYAQPLWMSNFSIGGVKHNVILAATQHDTVFAFDADSSPCLKLGQANLLDAPHGGTAGEGSVPSAPGGLVGSGFGDIIPEVGITGTPVIDPVSNTLYVVSKSVIPASSPILFFQRLHALDLGTGNEKFGGPLTIAASVPGTGDGSSGGVLPFDAGNESQRPGLAIASGVVYISWASHEDHSPYHGWIIAYKADLSQRLAVFNTTPNGGLGGIWMSGAAPAIDGSGNIYFATGNGSFDAASGFGNSVMKLGAPSSGSLPLLDFFTPFNQNSLNASDTDLGAGGVIILPDLSSGTHAQLLVQVGKDGTIHLLDRSNLGQYCSGCPSDTQIVQEIQNQVNGMWGTPAYWNGNLYIGGAQDGGTSGDNLKAFSFNTGGSGLLSTSPTSVSSHVYNFSGPTASVSSNGATKGIVWALDNSQYGPPTPNGSGPSVLHAYDATNLANELWNSSQAAGNVAGNAVKFTVPTIANGKVYVGTRTEIDVYGLLPN